MFKVRTRHGKVIHATNDTRVTLCGRLLKQPIIEPDKATTCEICKSESEK